MKSTYLNKAMAGLMLLMVSNLFVSCGGSTEWTDLVGTWKARHEVTVRWKEASNRFQAVSGTVDVVMTVHEDGRVEGTMGGASFQDAKVKLNGNGFTRALNLFTDYNCSGKLKGKLFEQDPFEEKEFTFPFNIKDNKVRGTIFRKDKRAATPIVDVLLEKQ